MATSTQHEDQANEEPLLRIPSQQQPQETQPAGPSSPPSPAPSTVNINPVGFGVWTKLLHLELPKFHCDVTQFRTFRDSFNSSVHANPRLSKITKFNYLKTVLDGAASRAIGGLPITEENYDAAVEILNDRYGKPQQHWNLWG